MIIIENLEYKGKKKMPKGHRGNMVFQPLGYGRYAVRSMPSHYYDANSEAQQPCRNNMKRVMVMHRKLKPVYYECFEGKKKPYNMFKHENLLLGEDQCMVSCGSMPSLNSWMEDGYCWFDMVKEEWSAGDVLRVIKIPDDGEARYEDVAIEDIETKTVAIPVEGGYSYCVAHVRRVGEKELISTEYMSEYEINCGDNKVDFRQYEKGQ